MLDFRSNNIERWRKQAASKKAIVPAYFEVTPNSVLIVCGKCRSVFQRNLVPNVNYPTFVCPSKNCRARNWVPVRYDLQF